MSTLRTLEPAVHFAPELLLKAQGIRIVFFDVDGVMTDGGLFFSEHGESLKRFSVLDGQGLKLLQQAGIIPAVITGNAANALPMITVNSTIPRPYASTQARRLSAGISIDTMDATASPTPLAANTPPSASSAMS